jgi:hypothetical protein
MALAELAEKGPDVDMLRQMVQFAAQRLMDMEAETLCGAGYDEKNPERLNSRNGYRDRSWETRAGTVGLRVPKLRQGSYRGGRAKLNTPISGRAAPMGEDRARVFRSTEDEQTTTPEPLSGIQGQGGHRGFGR